MSDQPDEPRLIVPAQVPALPVTVDAPTPPDDQDTPKGAGPEKLVRITSMVRELLEETRQAPPDERGRIRLREIHERAIGELREALPEDLFHELDSLIPPIESVPTESEIRVAQAQLVGWLEGLFHGIQAAVWAQQMQARAQLEELRRRGGLPPGIAAPAQQTERRRPPSEYL